LRSVFSAAHHHPLTEEVVRLVPRSYREAALAVGNWRMIQEVVIPAAPGGT
jgi:ABC-type phosphate transport system permease subunit